MDTSRDRREREMEVGAIQSRRLREKNEIHSSSERDPKQVGDARVKGEARERDV